MFCNNERIRGVSKRCIQLLCGVAMDFNFFSQIKKRAFLGCFFIYVKGILKGIFKDFLQVFVKCIFKDILRGKFIDRD